MVKVYDAQQYYDRYTIYYGKVDRVSGFHNCIVASENFDSPGGVYQHSTGQTGPHNGKRITLKDLPEKLRDYVTAELKNIGEL